MANNNKPIINTTKTDKLKPKTHSQDFIPSFIRKTYDILEEAKFPQLIDWNSEGNAIVIKKPSEFSQKVLPVYFKHNNLTSFVRQLNMYNFHKRRSQNLEHIYSHELFQKGKRHLLKEIKRKTHDNPEKVQKSPESQETPKSEDVSTLMNENQFLKRLYNEAMARVALLENQAKELANQNQSLWAQIYNNRPMTDREKAFKPLVATFEGPKELTQEQMSMTMGKVTLNISSGNKGPVPMPVPATKLFPVAAAAPLQLQQLQQQPQQPQHTAVNVMPFTKFFSSGQQQQPQKPLNMTAPTTTEESSGSTTEVSPNSPVMQQMRMESEGVVANPLMIMNQSLQIPKLNMPQFQALHIPHIQQAARMSSDALGIGISRQEMSVGQLFDAWNTEFQHGEEVLCFADQKGDNKTMMMTTNVPGNAATAAAGNMPNVFQDKSLLGKRKFDTETNIHVPEPTMKRHELSIFSRKGMISTGIEDKEIHEGAGGSADDIDLMNFNQPFCGWPKAS